MSAIIYLRSYKTTSDTLRICIKTSEGKEMHNIPILKIKNYDINAIFDKGLLLLIPFYIFNFESKLHIINKDMEKYDELLSVYKGILDRLNKLHKESIIDEFTKLTITELTKMVVNNLAYKYDNIRKGVSAIMGGKILDHPAKTIRNEGIEEGKKEGRKEGRKEGILVYIKLAKRFNVDETEIVESIVKEFNVTEEYARKLFGQESERVEDFG